MSGVGAGPARALTLLAFDYGTQRVGVACGNTFSGQAQGLKTIAAEGDARWRQIAAVIAEWQPDALVVGVPFHPDGAEHENTRRARKFARQLHGRHRLPVHEVDERWSTTEAQARGARDADAGAAVIILEQHLATLADAARAAALDAAARTADTPLPADTDR